MYRDHVASQPDGRHNPINYNVRVPILRMKCKGKRFNRSGVSIFSRLRGANRASSNSSNSSVFTRRRAPRRNHVGARFHFKFVGFLCDIADVFIGFVNLAALLSFCYLCFCLFSTHLKINIYDFSHAEK